MTLDRPIIVVGTHRSGTTFLGEVLERHPDVAYWVEPRHVWTFGNAFKPDDVLVGSDARERVAKKIRGVFGKFTERHGVARFAEKTPSNCLRLPFIDAVFPDCRFVHIHRDGRGVVRSTREKVSTQGPEMKWVFRRLAGTPVYEWPALASRFMLTFGSRLRGKPMAYWGPRPPGWRTWLERGDAHHVLLAKQWSGTIRPVLEFRESMPAERWMDIGYAEFTRDPVRTTERVLEWAGLSKDSGVLGYVEEKADPGRVDRWREAFTADELEDMRPIVESDLLALGYEW